MKRDDACKLKLREIRIYKRQLIRILQIGFPAGIQGSLFSISNVIIQSSVNSFGITVMSGNASAQNIEGFVYTAMNSVSQTALNFIGQNHGAGKYDRVKKIMFICLGFVLIIGLTLGLTAFAFGRPLLSIYISDSAEAIEYGMIRIAYICIPYFLCGLMDVATGSLRGIGSSITPLVITVAGVCGFRIVWIKTVFKAFHSLESLYISYTVSWAMTFIVEAVVFLFLLRHQQKKLAK